MVRVVGIDGGGTRTTLALADGEGREQLRRSGPAGLVDPRDPTASARVLAGLVRDALAAVGTAGPADVLCAGLAGVGGAREREVVRSALLAAGVSRRVLVLSDGETALYGALSGGPGILVVAGTGSVAWGRAADGRVERCGGWGMIVGDEGSGYAIGRAALRAALHAADGRGPPTRLLALLLRELELGDARAIPPWVGRADKASIAALFTHVVAVAREGDVVANDILRSAASGLAEHVAALHARLQPWAASTAVVLHGGVARHPAFAPLAGRAVADLGLPVEIREPRADAVGGAVQLALHLAADPSDSTGGGERL